MSSVAWPLKADSVENYISLNRVFSNAQCDEIIRVGKASNLKNATTDGNKSNMRMCNVSFLDPSDIEWAYVRMADMANEINARFFNFDLWGFGEGFQFTEYQAPEGKYDFHIDKLFNGILRKLSIVVQLTDSYEYEGGDLELMFSSDPISVTRTRGDVIIFPSYVLHRVTPLTKGTRYSLVSWLSGPAFK